MSNLRFGPEDVFETKDLDMAAFLRYKRFNSRDVKVVNGDEGLELTWCYQNTPELSRELDSFRREEARVEPARFTKTLSQVKGEVARAYEQARGSTPRRNAV